MKMLNMGGDGDYIDNTTDSFESLRCREVLPDIEYSVPEASIIYTPLGIVSIRRPDSKSRVKRVKTWCPAPKMTTWWSSHQCGLIEGSNV